MENKNWSLKQEEDRDEEKAYNKENAEENGAEEGPSYRLWCGHILSNKPVSAPLIGPSPSDLHVMKTELIRLHSAKYSRLAFGYVRPHWLS